MSHCLVHWWGSAWGSGTENNKPSERWPRRLGSHTPDGRYAYEDQYSALLGVAYRSLMQYQAGDRPIPAPLARLVRLLDWLQQTGQLDAALPHLRDDD